MCLLLFFFVFLFLQTSNNSKKKLQRIIALFSQVDWNLISLIFFSSFSPVLASLSSPALSFLIQAQIAATKTTPTKIKSYKHRRQQNYDEHINKTASRKLKISLLYKYPSFHSSPIPFHAFKHTTRNFSIVHTIIYKYL